jgi:hypothetical protein
MRWVVGMIVVLVVVTEAEAQPGTSRSSSPPPRTAPRAPVVPAPVLPGSGSGGAPTRTNPIARPASPTATPFSLSGQTVCSPGTVDERPPEERQYWFDGATVGLPGHRCITLH